MSKEVTLLVCIFLQTGFILGNTEYVDITEFPYHVSIQKYGQHACSGAFIHESWILTVASCIFNVDSSAITVRARTSTASAGGNELQVSTVIVHKDFDKYVYFNDIALVKLKVPAEFGEKLLPIGLPAHSDYQLDDGTMCFVTGWKQDLDDTGKSQLAVTAVPLVNQNTCIKVMPRYEPVSEKMVCAGNMSHGVETCQGDLGAPLMEDHTLIGVLSYGLGCKTMIHPGVYTRISSYVPWISASSGVRYA